jgi:hypothetical protein
MTEESTVIPSFSPGLNKFIWPGFTWLFVDLFDFGWTTLTLWSTYKALAKDFLGMYCVWDSSSLIDIESINWAFFFVDLIVLGLLSSLVALVLDKVDLLFLKDVTDLLLDMKDDEAYWEPFHCLTSFDGLATVFLLFGVLFGIVMLLLTPWDIWDMIKSLACLLADLFGEIPLKNISVFVI